MNFDEAIRAHTTWKVKLSMCLAKPDGSVKAADLENSSTMVVSAIMRLRRHSAG